jgi:hypothetical protein
MSARGEKKTIDDIPLDLIQEAAKNYETVAVRITRRNDRGQLATVYNNVQMETMKLAEIDNWLRERAGGGRFRIEVKDPRNSTQYVMKAFHVMVEGPPHPPRYLDGPTDQPGQADYPMGPAFGGTPVTNQFQPGVNGPSQAWIDGLHPSQRAAYMQHRERPAPGATVASDQLALKQYQEHKAETARQIAKLESMVERQADDNRRLQEQLASERDRAREERHKVELEMLREQMKLIGERKPEPAKELDIVKIAATLAPFAPVLSAMVTSRETAASKGLEVQQQGLSTLMQATLSQANKPDAVSTMLTQLGPVVIPLLKDMMDAKSPKAQAELFNSMVENNLNTVAMMAQLIEAFGSQGGDEPWWMAPIKEALGGVVGMTEAYMQGKGGLPGQQLPPGAAMPQMGPPAQAPAAFKQGLAGAQPSMYTTVPTQETIVQNEDGSIEAEAEVIPSNGQSEAASEMEASLNPSVQQKMMLKLLPAEFQTPEWRAIVVGLLNQNPAEPLAELIARHIEHLIDFGMLPMALASVQDDPVTTLSTMMQPLPVYQQNQAYIDDVIYRIAQQLIDDEYVEPVTPAPPDHDQPAPPAAG